MRMKKPAEDPLALTPQGQEWEEWQLMRRLALYRDRHKCRRCGAIGERLDVHHLAPRRCFPDGHPWKHRSRNLVALCKHCHAFMERKEEVAKAINWVNREMHSL